MPKDFLSNQIKTGQIIGSGSQDRPEVIIINANVTDGEGGINTDVLTNKAGDDVFLFVSGTIGGRNAATPNSVSVFGGDVVISGSLFDANGDLITGGGGGSLPTGSINIDGSITHTQGVNIGSAPDDDYTDGLFTDLTENTLLGDVIDRFNEVLGNLAPKPAPNLSKIDARNSDTSYSKSAKLSFGLLNPQENSGYFSVLKSITLNSGEPVSDIHFANVDVNGSYEPESPVDGFHKLGIADKQQTFFGDLNYHVTNDTYSNSIQNYPDRAFNDGDKGILKLYLNNNEIHSVDLSSIADTSSSLNISGSGFFNITNDNFGKFSNNEEFNLFSHRTASWIVDPSDQVNGLNFVTVVHEVGGDERVTTSAQWVNDNNSDPLTVSSSSLTLNTSDSAVTTIKQISGVKYFTGASLNYSANVENFYKFIYGDTPVTFSESENAVSASLSFTSFAIPDIDTTSSEDHTKILSITSSSQIGLPSSNRIITSNAEGIGIESNITHPLKSIASIDTIGRVRGILIDNVDPTSTETLENFDDEVHRLVIGDYLNQADINTGNYWDETQSLNSGSLGYEDSLLIHNGKLMSTSNSLIVNNANFSSLDNSPSNNVDYSSNIKSDPKFYIRKFQNTTGSAIRDFSFTALGNSNALEGTSLGSTTNNINISFKIPGQTGWLDAAKDFIYNNISDSDGGNLGTFSSDLTTNPENYFTFGIQELANLEHMLIRVRSNKSWSGDLDRISIDFNGGVVDTNIENLTQTDFLNVDNSVDASNVKLSFGTSLVKSQDFEYVTTGDVTFSSQPGDGNNSNIEYTKNNIYISETNISGNFILSADLNDNYFSLTTTSLSNSQNPIGIFAPFNTALYEVVDPNNLSISIEHLLSLNSSTHGIHLEENKNYYFWRESDNNWYFSETSFPNDPNGTGPYVNVTGINGVGTVDANSLYTASTLSNNTIRKGIYDGTQTITGIINDDILGQGTNNNKFPDNAWGRGEAHKGILKLEINGVIHQTIDLSDITTSGSFLTNNSGLIISSATQTKDNQGLSDYRYFYRTGTIQIDPVHQRLGWNYARVLHEIDGSTTDITNYVEWVNNDTDGPEFESISTSSLFNSITESSDTIASSEPLSGIFYFHTPVGKLTQEVNDVYKYIYSPDNNAINYSTSNVSINSITVTGDGIINSTVNSSSRSLPNLDTSITNAFDKSITIETDFTYQTTSSLPGNLISAELNYTVKHPMGNAISGQINLPKPLIYRINDTETATVEDFSAESYRLQSLSFSSQTDLNSSSSWDSSESLTGSDSGHNDGLQMYNDKLVYPNLDFSDDASVMFKGPVNNPDYSNQSGERTFYRKFQNTTSNSQFGFTLRIKGTNTTISTTDLSDPSNSLSANEIKVYAKIPTTSNSQSTGFMDLGNPFNSGQTSDDDGCLQGSLNDEIINTGTGTSNIVTFGSSFLSPSDYVIIKIVADESWSGELNRIEVVWS